MTSVPAQRFLIGGKDKDKRDVILRYDKKASKWDAYATKLQDFQGGDVSNDKTPIWGILFPVVQQSGIYHIVMVFDGGDAVKILEREDKKPED